MRHAIPVAAGPAGCLIYSVPLAPDRVPKVAPKALLLAWSLARQAADAGQWGPPRHIVFDNDEDTPIEIAIVDPDAGAWAEAVDLAFDLGTLEGLAVCLRLLALVDLLGRAPSLRGFFTVSVDGIALAPELLRAAAQLPLDGAARFDAARFGRLVSPTPRIRS